MSQVACGLGVDNGVSLFVPLVALVKLVPWGAGLAHGVSHWYSSKSRNQSM